MSPAPHGPAASLETPRCPMCGHTAVDGGGAEAPAAEAGAVQVDPDAAWAVEELRRIEAEIPPFPEVGLPWWLVEDDVLDVRSHDTRKQIMERWGVGHSQFHVIRRNRKWNERRAVLEQLMARRAAKRALSRR